MARTKRRAPAFKVLASRMMTIALLCPILVSNHFWMRLNVGLLAGTCVPYLKIPQQLVDLELQLRMVPKGV
jgi:hypothetical protein